MAKCNLCGAKIKPYFNICFDCSKKMSEQLGSFEQNTKATFMEKMGITIT